MHASQYQKKQGKRAFGTFEHELVDLERTSRKTKRSVSNGTAEVANNTTQEQVLNDTIQVSIKTLRENMVNLVVLIADEHGVLWDQEGHARNKAGQKIDTQGGYNFLFNCFGWKFWEYWSVR